MWSFKTFLAEDLDAVADKVFGQRAKNAKMDHVKIITALGIKTNDRQLQQINQGSLATVYQHPEDPTKVIKVTADAQDAKNLVKAQRLGSPNIVKIYNSAKISPRATALVADFVKGDSMPYNTNALLGLINGDDFEEARQAVRGILRPDRTRRKILTQLGMDSDEERMKLSRLFQTLAGLEKLGIDMYDFTDNILDAGSDYVIIDMGM
jgi:hypothetical protein